MAGSGFEFGWYYPGLEIAPNGTAHLGVYGGLIAVRDTR
jgi:hypothetical protein